MAEEEDSGVGASVSAEEEDGGGRMPGGYGRGNRHRYWYRRTGMPGWMRFEHDPRYDPRGYDYPPPPEEMPPTEPVPMGYPPGRPMPYQRWTPEDELRMLEEEESMLEDGLKAIKDRIEELKKETKKETKKEVK